MISRGDISTAKVLYSLGCAFLYGALTLLIYAHYSHFVEGRWSLAVYAVLFCGALGLLSIPCWLLAFLIKRIPLFDVAYGFAVLISIGILNILPIKFYPE